jgi:hypothetical protein
MSHLGRSGNFAKYTFCAKQTSGRTEASGYLNSLPPFIAIMNAHLTDAQIKTVKTQNTRP